MTFYGAKDIAASFRTVRRNTLTVAHEIPEDQYGFQATPDTRTVAQQLVHIATGTRMALTLHRDLKLNTLEGFNFMGALAPIFAEEQKTRTKQDILDLLTSEGEAYAAWVESLTDGFLAQVVTFPPPIQPSSKTRFEMLLSPKEHEMHHRAQLMVLQRMVGLKPHLTRQMEAFRAQRAAEQK